MGNTRSTCCTCLGSDPEQQSSAVSDHHNHNPTDPSSAQPNTSISSSVGVQNNSSVSFSYSAVSPSAQQNSTAQLPNSVIALQVASSSSNQNSAQHPLQASASAACSSSSETILTTVSADANLDALVEHVQNLLNKAKGSCSSSSDRQNPGFKYWKYLDNSELNKVKDFLSESADGASDLAQSLSSLSQDGADALKSSAETVLHAIGKSHWAAAGLLLVWFVLERLDSISENRAECLDLLDEMYRLARYIRDLKRTAKIRPRVAELMEESLQLVAQGAILCCSRFQKSWFSRFLGASLDAQRLETLRKDLDKTHRHLMLEMMICVYDAQHGIQFERQKLYPRNAVGRDHELRRMVEMLEFESDKNVVAVTLYGLGGIGKTTLGDAVYASVLVEEFRFSKVSLFDTLYMKPLLIKVQKAIIEDISYATNSEPRSHTQGQVELFEVFQQYPCFVYIDNVLDVVELQKLLPPELDNCKKLRLLLTTRDANVRDGLDIQNPDQNKLFDVNSLPAEKSSIVLRKHMGNSAQEIASEEFEKLLKICGGIPLCLEMVGRFIRNEPDKALALRSIREEQKHHRDGHSLHSFGLKHLNFFEFAFNGLNQSCKDAFLDICAFLVGIKTPWFIVTCIYGEDVVKVLENRGLIRKEQIVTRYSVSDPYPGTKTFPRLEMHDVVLESGRKILKCEVSRIRSWQHLRSLLEADLNESIFSGIKAIDIIEMEDLEGNAQETVEILKVPARKLDLSSSCLRHFCNVYTPEDRKTPPREVIEIKGTCRAAFENLLTCTCPYQALHFDVSKCKSLKELSYSPTAAVNLSQLPESLRSLKIYLADGGRDTLPINLGQQENQLLLPHLQLLIIDCTRSWFSVDQDSSSMCEMPNDLYRLGSLQHLWIWNCRSLSKIPDDIEKCRGLSSLAIINSEKLEELPQELCLLSSLQALDLRGCVNLRKLPDNFAMLSSLSSLVLRGCENLCDLADGFDSLSSLQTLDIVGCNKLESRVIDKIRKMETLKLFIHKPGKFVFRCPNVGEGLSIEL